MERMLPLILGLICAFMGLTFLVGCFVRVDSPGFIARASGNAEKIVRLHSLQDAWDKLGKLRQFIASSSGYLIMAVGLILLWHDQTLAKYYLAVPLVYAANLIALLWVRGYAKTVLDGETAGGSEVLRVIKQHIRICISFSVIYVLLARA